MKSIQKHATNSPNIHWLLKLSVELLAPPCLRFPDESPAQWEGAPETVPLNTAAAAMQNCPFE